MATAQAPPPPPTEVRLVVGVDYGKLLYSSTQLPKEESLLIKFAHTRATGVAHGNTGSKTVDSILSISSWPGQGNANEVKTPSQIAYGSGDDFPDGFRWGSDIPIVKGLARHVWIKLLLNSPSTANGGANMDADPTFANKTALRPPSGYMSLPPGKAAIDVVSDYLSGVYKHTLQRLSQHYGREYIEVTPIDFVLTVPAIWSDKARNLTKEAARRAGFGSRPDDRINLVSEPEAAAIYTIKSTFDSTRNANTLQVGDSFVMVDAGGGTVDLITYEVIQTEPELKIVEKVVGSGGNCGSTFIDSHFQELLRNRVGDAELAKIPIAKRGPGSRFMRDFETVKRGYDSGETPNTKPTYLTLNVPDNEAARIEDSEFELRYEEVRETFRPVIDEIIALVNGQMSKVHDQGGKVKHILLVGGFGESDHLYKTLSNHVWAPYGKLSVIRPASAWSAVARGAVLWGLQGDLVVDKRRCRRHYGTELLKHFDPMVHSEVDAMISTFSGLKMAKNQISWIINRGDNTDSNKRFRLSCVTSFNRGEKLIHTTQLVACDSDEAAANLRDKEVYDLCLLTADLSEVPEREFDECQIGSNTFLRAEFSIEMTFLPADIRFETWFKGKCYGAESYFTYGEDEDLSPVDHNIHFRAGMGVGNVETFTPRALIYDLKGGFGSLRKINQLYQDDADLARIKNLDLNALWSGKNETREASKVEKNQFQQSLDEEEDILDRQFRPFAEECDLMQGLQVLTTVDDAWGGFATRYINSLRDEYPKATLWTWALERTEKTTRDRVLSKTAASVQSLIGMLPSCTTYIPINVPRPSLRLPSYVTGYNPSSAWRTSALIASALESSLLPSRLRATGGRAASGLKTLTEVSAVLNTSGSQQISTLQLNSLDEHDAVHGKDTDPINFFPNPVDFSWGGVEKHVFAAHEVLRGIGMSHDATEDAHATVKGSRQSQSYCSLPFPVLSSFPDIFEEKADGDGHTSRSLKLATSLRTSSSVVEHLRTSQSLVSRVVASDERETISNGLAELYEAYQEGWGSDSDEFYD
ncbi:hypothetical protein H072_2762 [Dactylellina haptotyla CBS 200.50]|uniref:DML1/Misato tubulin domain-containing protein n=1 Tax=Dactylellina haptotyla (strain CBS 200.50) TaxID=1284197 RepID=S8AJW1_DACHA|nr:hypothetical protein H072_2762 [Dactylellina haptotyla CBS 200.50]